MLNIVLLGPPGSGKGTHSKWLVQKYNFIPIAVGELLRKQIVEDTPDRPLIEHYVNQGQLVPNEISFKLVKPFIEQYYTSHSLLFDGFPRNQQQAALLDNLLMQYNIEINGVIFLDVPYEIVLERLKNRARIEGRADDQDETKIKTRMDIYEKEALSIMNYYKDKNKVYRVEGTQSLDQVTKAIQAIVNLFNSE